jgi:hypothetical protein
MAQDNDSTEAALALGEPRFRHLINPTLDKKVFERVKYFNDARHANDFETPWGYDFAVKLVGSSTYLHEEPRRFSEEEPVFHDSIRDLFRSWRLRVCRCRTTKDPLETVRLALHSIQLKRHLVDLPTVIDEIYEGSAGYCDMHFQWLEDQALIENCDGSDRETIELSREGRSALFMLIETAPGSNVDTSPVAILRRQEESKGVILHRVNI